MPDKTSLRALIQDRKAKQVRPTYRHLFTLSPELYSERAELEEELSELPHRRSDEEEGQRPRMNDPRAKMEKRIAELDQVIANHTVAVIFKAPSADQLAAKVVEWEKAKLGTLAQARDMILACYDHFDTDEDLGKTDLEELLPTLTQGETFVVSNTLSNLAVGEIDIPKSVRQSIAARKSGATSKPA
jgi:hypothetical protein